jgi:hypothetical protein
MITASYSPALGGVSQVRAVFLEGQPQHQHTCVLGKWPRADINFTNSLATIGAHAVVEPASGEDDLRVVADLLRLMGQVVGIDADTVATDQARAKRQEVPFGARGLEHLIGVDAELG